MKKIVIICLVAIFFYGSNANAQNIVTLDVNLPGVTNTEASGISGNNIVGSYSDGSGDHGFLYNGSTYVPLDDSAGTGTYASGISGSNIVGSYVDVSNVTHGFFYNGAYTTLTAPVLGATYVAASGISGSNIVGTYDDASYNLHGFIYNGSTYTPLDVPGAIGTYASGISGDSIIGSSSSGSGDSGFVYSYSGSTYTPFNVILPGVTATDVNGIGGNNIVGSYIDSGGTTHAFFYNGSTYNTINVPGATYAEADGISGNNIVGWYTNGTGNHGFVDEIPSQWANAVSGSWSIAGNWISLVGSIVPNAVGAGAIINVSTSADLTVTLDSPQTIGTLLLGNSGLSNVGYILVGSSSNTLTLNNFSQGATITVTDGTHVINAPIVLADNLTVSGSGQLTFGSSSSITENGTGHYSLTMNGAGGTLILGGSDTYSGGTFVELGTLITTSDSAIPNGSSLVIGASGASVFNNLQSSKPVSSIGPAIVSEPSIIALLISGLITGGLFLFRRKI